MTSLHITYLVQCFRHFVKCFRMDNLLRARSLHNLSFQLEESFTHLSPQYMLIDRISQHIVHVYPPTLFTICMYPPGQTCVQTILSIVLICQSHYRLSTPCACHFSTCVPIFKASSMCTLLPCRRSKQYPIESLQTLLFRHLPFISVQESIYVT